MYYRTAKAAVVVYDVTKSVSYFNIFITISLFVIIVYFINLFYFCLFSLFKASFEKAKSWVRELQRQANPNIVIALVGNKIDLVQNVEIDEDDTTENPRQVLTEEAKYYALENGLLFFETSAKKDDGVKVVFKEIGMDK